MTAYNEDFNDELGDLFTACRERSLIELAGKRPYIKMRNEGKEMLSALRSNLNREDRQLLDNYLENENLLRGMELDMSFLSGASILYQIEKRLDPSSEEYEIFTNKIAEDYKSPFECPQYYL